MIVKRYFTIMEDVFHEGGRELERPLKRVAAGAVIHNPFAGVYQEDLDELMAIGELLGEVLGERAVALLGGEAPENYGKAAIVGEAGEREHAAAILCTCTKSPQALADADVARMGQLAQEIRAVANAHEHCLRLYKDLALETGDLYAQVKGIGSRLWGPGRLFLNRNKAARERLELAKHEQIFGTVLLGYPAVRFRNKVEGRTMPIQWNEDGPAGFEGAEEGRN